MICPGIAFTAAGRLTATLSAGPTPTTFLNGIGLTAGTTIALDSNAAAGSISDAGIAVNAAGALYGTTSTAGSDVFQGGLRRSSIGQLVVAQADPVRTVNGNPLDANGALCIQ